MTSEEKDDVEGTIANLMAQIERIRETYVGEAAPKEPAPPQKPAVQAPAPTPAPAPPVAPAAPPAVAPPVAPLLGVPTQAESVRAFIAVFVVFFGLGAIVFAWLTMGIDDAQRLAAILLGVIATVVGYYFGQRGTTRAQLQATYAMNGWQAADARVRQLEDWMRQP